MSEGEVRALLSGERASALVSIWDRAWASYLDDGRARHSRARAIVVWDNARQLADDELTQLDGVARREVRDIPLYVFDEVLALHLKKHDDHLQTRGYPTYARQQSLGTGTLDGMPGVLHASCGYILDKAEAAIARYPVVRTVHSRPEWDFDLRDVADGGAAGLAPTQPIMPFNPPVPTLPTIRRPAKEKDGDQE